jgi:hypothetical protein
VPADLRQFGGRVWRATLAHSHSRRVLTAVAVTSPARSRSRCRLRLGLPLVRREFGVARRRHRPAAPRRWQWASIWYAGVGDPSNLFAEHAVSKRAPIWRSSAVKVVGDERGARTSGLVSSATPSRTFRATSSRPPELVRQQPSIPVESDELGRQGRPCKRRSAVERAVSSQAFFRCTS